MSSSKFRFQSVVAVLAVLTLAACGSEASSEIQPSHSASIPPEITTTAPSAKPESSEAASAAPQEISTPATPSDTPLTNDCAGTPTLPEGIDERVCSSDVPGAQQLVLEQYDSALVVSPSENIYCSFHMYESEWTPYVDCLMAEPLVSFGIDDASPAYDLSDRSDGPAGTIPVTLNYGEAATYGNFACISQEIGMSCWNTQTKHGMFLSLAESLSW